MEAVCGPRSMMAREPRFHFGSRCDPLARQAPKIPPPLSVVTKGDGSVPRLVRPSVGAFLGSPETGKGYLWIIK